MSDVCLILEGTYPYVRGGVSEWVHHMVTEMSDIQFSIVSIVPSARFTREEYYIPPSNVSSVINVFLHDYHFSEKLIKHKVPQVFELLEFFQMGIVKDEAAREVFQEILYQTMSKREEIDLSYVFSSKDFWNALLKMYKKDGEGITFLDYFWNYRFTFLPIVQLLRTVIPPAFLYHTISTGYAGLFASFAKIKTGGSMIVTEHGIYTKERRIEIAEASWIYERESELMKVRDGLSFFKRWWVKYFETMSGLAYTYADQITTLFEGNRQAQIKEGADPKKTIIIPNGVDLKKFEGIANERALSKRDRTIAYIGRIVPIKDIKTLIKACKIIVENVPDVKIFLIGPQEEETQYYQECSDLMKMMGIEKNVKFIDHVDMKDYYPVIDIVLLTSISEAQPLVVLEAGACGIPVVVTDVGACRELVFGRSDEDKALGESGIVCQFHSPEETALAVIKLLNDDGMYEKMSKAGRERAKKYYNETDMVNSYRQLYEQYI